MKFVAYLLAGVALLGACTGRIQGDNKTDTPTQGSIKIAVDESLKPLFDAEVYAFEGIYKAAHVQPLYTSEDSAIDALLKDSVRIAIVTRKLNPAELAVLDTQRLEPNQVTIARDGIALILHRNNPDSVINLDQIRGILEGKITDWKQINPKNTSGKLEVVFDHPKSGVIRYLRDSLGNFGDLPANCFALDNNEAVIDRVAQQKSAIGLIGVSWISDNDDSTSNQFLGRIKVAHLTHGDDSYQPYQAYIAQKQYPLMREIVMISRETKPRLGSGFVAFVASERGQRVILKLGLVPATMPLRIVEIKREPIQ